MPFESDLPSDFADLFGDRCLACVAPVSISRHLGTGTINHAAISAFFSSSVVMVIERGAKRSRSIVTSRSERAQIHEELRMRPLGVKPSIVKMRRS